LKIVLEKCGWKIQSNEIKSQTKKKERQKREKREKREKDGVDMRQPRREVDTSVG